MAFIVTATAELNCLILKKTRNFTSLEEDMWNVWMTTAWNYNINCIKKGFLYSSEVPGLLQCWRWTCSPYSALEFHCGQLPSGVLMAGQYCSAML